MTRSAFASIVTSGTGYSSALELDAGEWNLDITASSWGAATLETSIDGTTYGPAENASGAISLSSNKTLVVYGNRFYRLNVSSHASAITMKACRAS